MARFVLWRPDRGGTTMKMAKVSAIVISLWGAGLCIAGCGAPSSEQAQAQVPEGSAPSLNRVVLPSGSTLSADLVKQLAPGENLYVNFTHGGSLRVDASAGEIDYERVIVLKRGGAEETLASWLDRTYRAHPELLEFRASVFDLTAPESPGNVHPLDDVCYHCTCKGACCKGCKCYPIEC
jgi:hypothetical protein